MSVWTDIEQQIERRIGRRAGRAHPSRFKVRRAEPLQIEEVDGDLVLEAGDPDVEVFGSTAGLATGGLVAVVEDVDGDYLVLLPGGGAGDDLAAHLADTTGVHGIADTSLLITEGQLDAAIGAIPVDGLAATPSLRTLGAGAQQAAAGNVNLTGLAGLASAADLVPYFTGSGGAMAATALTPFARTLLDDTTQASARATLGLVPGSDVQAYSTTLAGLAAAGSAANKVPVYNGAGTAFLADITAAARALLDDADASTMLSTLGVSTFVKTLLDDADAATARATLRADRPFVKAYRNAAHSLANNAAILFDTETDANGWYDPATGRFQPTRAGQYRIVARAGANGVLTADNYVSLRLVNQAGTTLYDAGPMFQRGTSAAPGAQIAGPLITFNGSTDYIEVRFLHNQGGSIALAVGEAFCRFSAEWVSA